MEILQSPAICLFVVFALACIPFAVIRENTNREKVKREEVSRLISLGIDQPKDIAKHFGVSESWLRSWMVVNNFKIERMYL